MYQIVFGSMVHVRLRKLEDRIKIMLFIGYEICIKEYRCLDPMTYTKESEVYKPYKISIKRSIKIQKIY